MEGTKKIFEEIYLKIFAHVKKVNGIFLFGFYFTQSQEEGMKGGG